jgi:hypothetical protein
MLDMGAGGDLRHHAAKGGVILDLAEHRLGFDDCATVIGVRRTIATAVSSQLVSIPRARIRALFVARIGS